MVKLADSIYQNRIKPNKIHYTHHPQRSVLMQVNFSKMHGLGNDFVIIEAISQLVPIEKLPFSQLANRHLGIGFDQLLLIKPSKTADFLCQIFNSDGSEAEQCGNGMRCVGRFINEHNLSSKKSLTIETKSGVTKIDINDFEHIQVNMGIPSLAPSREININNQLIQLSILSLGNPHAIFRVESAQHFPISDLGPKISQHSIFPQGANVGFMEIVNREHIRLRTFERGAGETFACGSNSCAAVVAGIEDQLLNHKVRVELALGELLIEWEGKDHPVIMTGAAQSVFEGVVVVAS